MKFLRSLSCIHFGFFKPLASTFFNPKAFIRPLSLFSLLLFSIASFASKIEVSGDVDGNWNTDSVIVNGNITLPWPNSLSISKGCKILFKGHYTFQIYGRLVARGDSNSIIDFRPIDTTGFAKSDTQGSWGGMYLNTSLTAFEYCSFQNAKGGRIYYVEYGSASFKNCSFYRNEGGVVIALFNRGTIVTNCIIANNNATGIFVEYSGGDTLKVKNNTLFRNSRTGILIYHYNVYRSYVEVANNIMWGNQEDLRYMQNTDGYDSSKLLLRNCILQTGTIFEIQDATSRPVFNATCFSAYPNFRDTATADFRLTWSHYPLGDSTKSIAIDNGFAFDPLDADSSRADIGAIPYLKPDGMHQTAVRFLCDTTLGYRSALTVHFTNLSHEGNSPAWTWDFGDGSTSNEKDPTHTYSTVGLFTVKLKALDADGHQDSLAYNGLIYILPGTRVNLGIVSGTFEKQYSPYYVFGNIVVPQNNKLEIEPGVEVLFMGPYEIEVKGALLARGTQQDSILLDRFDKSQLINVGSIRVDIGNVLALTTDWKWKYAYGGWLGIHFNKEQSDLDTSRIEYCNITSVRGLSQRTTSSGLVGAVVVKNSDHVTISHNHFYNNLFKYISADGDLASCGGVTLIKSNGDIRYNRFEQLLEDGPGAILAVGSRTLAIANNQFENIRTHPIWLVDVRRFFIDSNLFKNNLGIGSCIGISLRDSTRQKEYFSEITNNTFIDNKSIESTCISGGNLEKVRFYNNKFINNWAHDTEAGINVWGDSLYILNNLFVGNQTSGAVGNFGAVCINLYLDGSEVGVIANNTMVNNKGNYYQSSGIYAWDKVKVYNNISRNLTTPEITAVTFVLSWQFSTFKNAYNNNIKGGYTGGGNNFDKDPLFANTDAAMTGFSLNPQSPCIDKGYNYTSEVTMSPTDLGGNSRIDTMDYKIDVGAYEYAKSNHPPDNLTLSNATIKENLPVGTFIGKFVTQDADTNEVFTYSFSNSSIANDNQKFLIIGDSLKAKEVFKYQALSTIPVTVKTTDRKNTCYVKDLIILVQQNTTTAIVNVEDLPVSISMTPNPFHDYISLQNSSNEPIELYVFNASGSLIFNKQYKRGTSNVDGRMLSKGMYYILVKTKKGYYSTRFLKQ